MRWDQHTEALSWIMKWNAPCRLFSKAISCIHVSTGGNEGANETIKSRESENDRKNDRQDVERETEKVGENEKKFNKK